MQIILKLVPHVAEGRPENSSLSIQLLNTIAANCQEKCKEIESLAVTFILGDSNNFCVFNHVINKHVFQAKQEKMFI